MDSLYERRGIACYAPNRGNIATNGGRWIVVGSDHAVSQWSRYHPVIDAYAGPCSHQRPVFWPALPGIMIIHHHGHRLLILLASDHLHSGKSGGSSSHDYDRRGNRGERC